MRRAIAAVLAGALVLVLALWAWPRSPEPAAGVPQARAPSPAPELGTEPAAPVASALPSRQVVEDAPLLTLHIEREGRAAPTMGRVLWTTLADPDQPPPELLSPAGVATCAHQGVAQIPLSRIHPTWLRVTIDGEAPASRLLWIPPAMAPAARTVRIDPVVANAWVFAVRADSGLPASGTAIRAEWMALDANRQGTGTVVTDAQGLATAPLPAAARVRVAVVGAPPSAAESQGARVATQAHDFVVPVLVPPPEVELRLAVFSEPGAAPLSGRGVMIFANHTDSGRSLPLGLLPAGHGSITAKLMPGMYRLGTLPQGSWDLEPDVVEVPLVGGEAAVRARRNADEVMLTFSGIRAIDMPFSVEARDADEPWGPGDDQRFLGPHHWHRESARVPRLRSPKLLVVRARGCAYRGRYEPPAGPEARVELRPAATLRVILPTGRNAADGVVTASSDHGVELVLPGRALLPAPGGPRFGFVGTAIVEPGTWTLAGAGSDASGRTLARTVNLVAGKLLEVE